LVALVESKAIGFVDLQKLSSPAFPLFKPRSHVFIDNFYVVPDFRGSGVAQLLFDRAKIWSTDQGVARLQLKVYEANQAAIKFYRKQDMLVTNTTFELEL